jgi:hypothetical protein
MTKSTAVISEFLHFCIGTLALNLTRDTLGGILVKNVLWIGAAMVVLAGCGASRSPLGNPATLPNTAAIPQAKSSALLYVANPGDGNVLEFSYPAGQLVNTLTGISTPAGECTSKKSKGNWWVVASSSNQVLEYAHGGTTPLSSRSISPAGPSDCSIDPKTGNLAVTILTSQDVEIFDHAKGTGKLYTDDLQDTYNAGYDGNGNLFVDGYTSASQIAFLELPRGGKSFETITLNQSFSFPGAIRWDGTYLAILDPGAGTIYQFTIDGKKGAKAGSTPLDGVGNPDGFWIQKNIVAVADLGRQDVAIWNYPAGGSPIQTITTGIDLPADVTISVGK